MSTSTQAFGSEGHFRTWRRRWGEEEREEEEEKISKIKKQEKFILAKYQPRRDWP